jgi:hypothetical protein
MLHNGQQIHKVPYHRPTGTDQVHGTRNTSSTSLDGTAEVPKMSISKTGRKSFTLGGSIVPPLAKLKASPTPVPSPQKVAKTKANDRVVIPTVAYLSCETLEHLKGELHRPADDLDISQRHQSTEAFVNQSLFYTLSNAETLLQSFHDPSETFQHSPLPHLDSHRLAHSFRDWNRRNGALIFDSLSTAVEVLFNRPPELDVHMTPRSKSAFTHNSTGPAGEHEPTPRLRYFTNHEAAHLVMICIHALTSSVPFGWGARSWSQLRSLRSWGVVIPTPTADTDTSVDSYVGIIDALEYEPAIRLADRLLQGIGARICFEHILQATHEDTTSAEPGSTALPDSLVNILVRHLEVTENVALDRKRKMRSTSSTNKEPGWTVTATFMEWLKTIIIKKWNAKVEINKWSSVGTAVMLLHELRKCTCFMATCAN